MGLVRRDSANGGTLVSPPRQTVASTATVHHLESAPVRSENVFQGGQAVEVFGASGSNPTERWRISGTVTKVYDKSVKGYVFRCDGGPSMRMQLPKDERRSLGLVQPYLVLQINVRRHCASAADHIRLPASAYSFAPSGSASAPAR